MNAKISEKVLPQKSIKNIVLSAPLRAEKSIKNKSEFCQKSLTQAWDFFEFLECKRLLFDTFSGSRLREISKTLKEKNTPFQYLSQTLELENSNMGVFFLDCFRNFSKSGA